MTATTRPSRALAAFCLSLVAFGPLLSLSAIAATTTATPTVASTDPGWPRSYGIPGGGTAVLYQPQIESWDGHTHMVVWSAVSYMKKGATSPALGTVRFEANTSTSTAARSLRFTDLKMTQSHFPSLGRDDATALVEGLVAAIPDSDRVIALDRVLAAMDRSQIAPKNRDDVKFDPPRIRWSVSPAILVNLDGPPVWSPIDGTDLEYAVNTNWDLLRAGSGDTVFLRDGASWYRADSLGARWTAAGKLPDSFSKLPKDDNWSETRANVPGKPATTVPAVLVEQVPAELLELNGFPVSEPVAGTSLYWVSNTESDLFRVGKNGPYYYLVAGRWYTANSFDGPWKFCTLDLPEDFKKIPVDHPRSRVLASVPGTDQAIEAVLLAQVPQTASVNTKEVKAPDVQYQGDPTFDAIPGTQVARAVNTDKDILKVGDLYFLCFQAVWFVGKSPTGPWEVATSVPSDIYAIPASSPEHHVTYVTVTDDDPNDDWVTFSYVAAYTGIMVAWGCAVWGSGWYYPPYVRWGPHPVYYPYPCTYGFGAWYNPYTGAYGRGAAVYGPYGGAGAAASYNPRTGTYARGAAAYGPYNARAAGQAWNPRTGTYAQTRQGANVYGNWGSSFVQRGDQWAQTGHVTNSRTGTTTTGARTSAGGAVVHRSGDAGQGTIARTKSGDIYAGHDGNVYRKQNGEWQKWDNGGWTAGHNPDAPAGLSSSQGAPAGATLDRDRDARQAGEQRLRDNQTWRAGGGTRAGAGSFRGGGGVRGGGRRR